MITVCFYPMDIRDSGQKDPEPNIQTGKQQQFHEATRTSGRIPEIRDIKVIKVIPGGHQLLCLPPVISGLLGAVQFLIVPATHCTRVTEPDPRRERPPPRKKERKGKSLRSSGGRYFQPQPRLSVNTGGLHPITSAVRHQQRGERRDETPVSGSSQWEALFQRGQVERLTNLLHLLEYAPQWKAQCVSVTVILFF